MQAQSEESPLQSFVLSPQALPPGTRVARWRVERRVGSGGNGTVYVVREKPGGPRFALKLAHTPEDRRFERESQALARVRHPGVVRRLEAGLWHAGPVRYPYLVMEYVEGPTLYDWARARNPTARQVAGLLIQTAEALARAHREDVLHRDFKGDNVRVDSDGRLKVLDWGAGWYPGAVPLTAAARLPPGTPPYHSPQALRFSVRVQRQHEGEPYTYSVADELYAVGVTFYRLLVEQYPPLRLSETSLETSVPWAVRVLNPRVPTALADLVQALLAFQPEARPPGMEGLAESVRRALAVADATWDEPLFEWYAGPSAQTRTTEAGAAQGPVAPGQEGALLLARSQRLNWVRAYREQRWLRRREMARVVTLPSPPFAGPAHRGLARGTWKQALAVSVLAAALAVGAAWWSARWKASVSSGAPLEAHGQQLASPSGSPQTATPSAAPSFFPSGPPWPEETMPTLEPRVCLTRLHRALLTTSTAAMLAACPGSQVRPAPARCPSEALETMRQLRLGMGRDGRIITDIQDPEGSVGPYQYVLVSDGPIASRLYEPFGRLPEGTLLYGRLWTQGEFVIGRYTRVKTPDGSEYPVCLVMADGKKPKAEGSRPGYTLLGPTTGVTVVDRFP